MFAQKRSIRLKEDTECVWKKINSFARDVQQPIKGTSLGKISKA